MDYLLVGHATKDFEYDGSYRAGGTVTYAALAAWRLGYDVGIVTSGREDELSQLLPIQNGINVINRTCNQTTCFYNEYHGSERRQLIYSRADQLDLYDIPLAWRESSIVLFAPVAAEVPLLLLKEYPRKEGQILSATIQGWLRTWGDDGKIHPKKCDELLEISSLLDVIFVSIDDLKAYANEPSQELLGIISTWSRDGCIVVMTESDQGATYFREGEMLHVPTRPIQAKDPTGAGDVFAAAFLASFYAQKDPYLSILIAHAIASFVVEGKGVTGLPDFETINRRVFSYSGHYLTTMMTKNTDRSGFLQQDG